jgi:hypothetical protein
MTQQNGQLVIYSIGPNQKDDHGEGDPKTTNSIEPDDLSARAWLPPLRGQSR